LAKAYQAAGMAFHARTGNLVLCCGDKIFPSLERGFSNDTWVGHIGRFIQRASTIQPQAAWQVLAPYPPGGSLLLYGGPTGAASFAGAASWTGTEWVGIQFGFPYPGERRTAMAYDAAHGNIVLFGGQNSIGHLNDTWTWGRQVACVPLEGAEVPVGTAVECFFKLGTGAQLVRWDGDGFSPKRQTSTTARFHANGPGPALIHVTWTDEEGEQSTDIRFTVTYPHGR
jgi:hypothetical protein